MAGIRETLKDAEVLLTGGSGFMGKVLLEKLLRSTEIRRIYVLIRPKKGLSPQARLTQMFKLPVFELVRKQDPELLKKVVLLEGDLTKDDLGLAAGVVERLAASVSIVFNFAASLKLEDTIKQLIQHNTVSALKLLELATKFKQLKAFVHLSTAFCHCEEEVLQEKMYDPPMDPYLLIKTFSWMDDELALTVQPKLLGLHPNGYTFTKRLTEGIMKDFGHKLPIVVVRPSIVTPALREPVPGWVDSLNGPIGVLVAGAKGVLRSLLCNPDNRAEVIPVDIAINSIILATWLRATTPNDGEVMAFNASSGEVDQITWGEVLEQGKAVLQEYPLDCGLWYPGGTIRTNPFTHALIVFFAQTLPAYLIDFIFLLLRQKRFMVYVQNRIQLGMVLLQYFTIRQWNFSTKYFQSKVQLLSEEEQEIFYTTNVTYDVKEYMKDVIIGARVYCMKEPLENLPRARKQLMMMYCIEKLAQLGILVFVSYFLYNNVASIRQFLAFLTKS